MEANSSPMGAGEYAYVYEPLPDPKLYIRLVKIQPSALFDDPVVCDLETIQLVASHEILNDGGRISRSREYAALSYSWAMNETGDATQTRTILLDGKWKAVTQNLYQGLLRIRRRTDKFSQNEAIIRIWIDAISIDQANNTERGAQVGIMDKIFRYASCLYVWLGEGESSEQDILVYAILEGLLGRSTTVNTGEEHSTTHPCSPAKPFWPDPPRMGAVLRDLHAQVIQHPHGRTHAMLCIKAVTEMIRLLIKLVSRRYFKRRWVVQELLYGREQAVCHILWGPVKCPDHVMINGLREAANIYDVMWIHYSFGQLPDLRQDIKVLLSTSEYLEILPPHLHNRPQHLTPRSPSPPSPIRANHDLSGEACGEQSSSVDQWSPIDFRRLRHAHLNGSRIHVRDDPSLKSNEILPFLFALDRFKGFRCGDPRDVVYGLISLDPSFGLIADYSRSVEETYVNFAHVLIERMGCVHVLHNLGGTIRQKSHHTLSNDGDDESLAILSLPSWVPDLRLPFYQLKEPHGADSSSWAMVLDADILLCKLLHLAEVVSVHAADATPQLVIQSLSDKEDKPFIDSVPFSWLRGSVSDVAYSSSSTFYRKGDRFCCLASFPHTLLVLRPDTTDILDLHTIINVLSFQGHYESGMFNRQGGFPYFSDYQHASEVVFKIR